MNIRISAIALSLLIGSSFAADPRMEQGAIFEAKGNYEMALGEYRAILAEQPKNAGAYFAAAEVRVKMKDYSGALANYRLAYKFEPTMSAAYEGAAKVYEALGQKVKAEEERKKDPKNNPAAAEEVSVAQAAPAPAAPAAETKAVEPQPAPAPAAEPAPVAAAPAPKVEEPAPAKVETPKPVETAKVAEPVKPAETPKAAPVAEPAKAEPAKVDVALPTDPFEKGKALFAQGKYSEAAPLWREVLRKQPGHAGAYYYAGLTRYEMGEMDKAEFNLKKGLEYKDEGNDANYFLAKIAQKSNKTEQELKFLNAYLKKAAPGAKYRKSAEERIAEIKAAKAEASKAVTETKAAEAKTDAKAETKAVEAKAEKPVEAKPAETAAVAEQPAVENEPSIADRPTSQPTIANANLLFSAGSFESALQMYKDLLETEQNPEERYFTMLQMGNIYREMRDFHSAVTRYREVVQQFPDSDWATEAERALEDAVWLEKHAKELPKRKH